MTKLCSALKDLGFVLPCYIAEKDTVACFLVSFLVGSCGIALFIRYFVS